MIDSTQLSVALTADDLAEAGQRAITVFNPTPGGRISKSLKLNIVSCRYTPSETSSFAFSSSSEPDKKSKGVIVLNTDGACAWNVSTDVSWIAIDNPAAGGGGIGKYAISYTVDANTDFKPRIGTMIIGGEPHTVFQAGAAYVVSAAGYNGESASPSMINAAFGLGLATLPLAAPSLPLPTKLGETEMVVVDSTGQRHPQVPLFYVSPNQLNFLMPDDIPPGPANVVIIYNDLPVATGLVNIAATSPGLFSANADGRGVAAANLLSIKGSQTTIEPIAIFDPDLKKWIAKPIDLGGDADQIYLVLYGTGLRGVKDRSKVKIEIGGRSVPIDYLGPQGYFIGLDQVNLPLPRDLFQSGQAEIKLTIDSKTANQVHVAFK